MSKKSMKVFLVKSVEYGSVSVFDGNPEDSEYMKANYVLLGSGVAEFDMVPDSAQVAAHVEALEKSKAELQSKYLQDRKLIEEKINSLRALTHMDAQP